MPAKRGLNQHGAYILKTFSKKNVFIIVKSYVLKVNLLILNFKYFIVVLQRLSG